MKVHWEGSAPAACVAGLFQFVFQEACSKLSQEAPHPETAGKDKPAGGAGDRLWVRQLDRKWLPIT